MSNACNKPERVSADGLARAAARGVERAIEARRGAGVELSPADVNDVSGGFLLIRGIPPMVDLAANIATNPAVNPALPAGALTAGF
jgi:hypothetical protein